MTPTPLDLRLESDPAVLGLVRERLREWIRPSGWDDPPIEELVLAVDEALANVIRHGYACERGRPIELSARYLAEPSGPNGVEIQIRDFGKQTDPTKICGRPLDEPRPGGLGVHLIRSMTDSAEYALADGGGMLLTLRKYAAISADPNSSAVDQT